jgi:hypothetical protein
MAILCEQYSLNIFKRKELFTYCLVYPARPNNYWFSIKTTFGAFITIPNQKKFNKIDQMGIYTYPEVTFLLKTCCLDRQLHVLTVVCNS